MQPSLTYERGKAKRTHRAQEITLPTSYLEVVRGELQHVPQDITDDLGLPLQEHIFVVQRLDDLRLYLKQKIAAGDQQVDQHFCISVHICILIS